MAVYAIGDIQGCYDRFRYLLEKIKFKPEQDQLWLTGDLVNRGGQSLQTLEYLYSIRESVVTVLGNHDLHLIAAFYGHKKLDYRSDLRSILDSPKCERMIEWLRQQPLLHEAHGHILTHAGIAPMWSLDAAKSYAREVETVLRSKKPQKFLRKMYGDTPNLWSEELDGKKRLRCIVNYFTRMRFVKSDGALDFRQTTHPNQAPAHLIPWFRYPERPTRHLKIIIGHWAALMGDSRDANIIALDTGCVWGGYLSAYNVQTGELTRCNC